MILEVGTPSESDAQVDLAIEVPEPGIQPDSAPRVPSRGRSAPSEWKGALMPGGLYVRTAGQSTRALFEPPCVSGFPETLPLGRYGYELAWAFRDKHPYRKDDGHVLILKRRAGTA
jgi:hypothetical protein